MIVILTIVAGCSNVESENRIDTSRGTIKTIETEKIEGNIVDVPTEIKKDDRLKGELSISSKQEVGPSKMAGEGNTLREVDMGKMAGEGNTIFSYPGNAYMQVKIINKGVNSLNFKILHLNSEEILTEGTLKPNETYDNTINPSDLSKGSYMISFLQDYGADMSAYVKVELLE